MTEGPGLFHSSEKPFSSDPATLLPSEVLPGLAPPKSHGPPSPSSVSQLRNTMLVMSMSTWTSPRSYHGCQLGAPGCAWDMESPCVVST